MSAPQDEQGDMDMARKPLNTTAAEAIRRRLPADILDRTVFIHGRQFTVKGTYPNRPKNCVKIEGVRGGSYICSVQDVLNGLKVAPVGIRKSHAAFSGWRPGMRCQFVAKGGKVITGTVKRVNQRTVSVTPDGGDKFSRYWRVSPGLLEAV